MLTLVVSEIGKIRGNCNFFSICLYFPNFPDYVCTTLVLKISENYFQKSYTIHSIF